MSAELVAPRPIARTAEPTARAASSHNPVSARQIALPSTTSGPGLRLAGLRAAGLRPAGLRWEALRVEPARVVAGRTADRAEVPEPAPDAGRWPLAVSGDR